MLAITQPLRVGDWVFVEDQYGVVEDIRLNYTFLRTLGGQQIVIPNEKLASGILRNDTLGDGVVGLDVAHLAPRRRRRRRAPSRCCARRPGRRSRSPRRRSRASASRSAASACPPPERAPREAELRLRCLARLRAEGLLGDAPG